MIAGKDGLVFYFGVTVSVFIESFIYHFPPLDNYSVTFVGFTALRGAFQSTYVSPRHLFAQVLTLQLTGRVWRTYTQTTKSRRSP